jgi:hypothetical protein
VQRGASPHIACHRISDSIDLSGTNISFSVVVGVNYTPPVYLYKHLSKLFLYLFLANYECVCIVGAMETEAFKRVVQIVGSKAEIARQCGVTGQHIQKWKSRVPAIHVVKLEKLTRGEVTREQLRPDVFYD